MWTTVNETLSVLQGAEVRMTGADKITASITNPFPEPAAGAATQQMQEIERLQQTAGDRCVHAAFLSATARPHLRAGCRTKCLPAVLSLT
jgi:hypothetical protein